MNNKYKILIIEDEENINNLLTALLETNGYQVISATSCENGKMMFTSHKPDLIILDLGLPDFDGMTFLSEIRKEFFTPVIIVSARTDEEDKVKALNMGANDYITKPFGSKELIARVRSALRICMQHHSDGKAIMGNFRTGNLEIDYEARRVFICQNEIKLTQIEFNIVAYLSGHSGKVITYDKIIKAIWGYNDINSTKKLQVNMANIRKKFGEKPGQSNYIVNELGVGYRMNNDN